MAEKTEREKAREKDFERVETTIREEEGILIHEAQPWRAPGSRGLGASYSDDPPDFRESAVPNAEEVQEVHGAAWQDLEEEEWEADLSERREGWGDGADEIWIDVWGLDEPGEPDDVVRIPVRVGWTVLDVKYALHLTPEDVTLEPNFMVLTRKVGGTEYRLRDDRTLANYEVRDGDELSYVRIDRSIFAREKKDYIRIVAIAGGRPRVTLVLVTVFPHDSVGVLKDKIETLAERHGRRIDAERQTLFFRGARLQTNDVTLRSLGVANDSVLDLRVSPSDVGVKRERSEGKFVALF